MADIRIHSRWKIYFQLLLVVLGLSLAAFVYLKVGIFLTNQTLDNKRTTVETQTKEIASFKLLTGYNKLQAVKILEDKQLTMPWSEHITKVITMLEDMKKIDSNETNAIVLSDFNVSLDKITLK